MKSFLVVIALAFRSTLAGKLEDFSNAQFLNIQQNPKVVNGTVHEADQKSWFDAGIDYEADKIKKEWVRITNATELDPKNVTTADGKSSLEHNFAQVNLSFPFPFFGGNVHHFTLTTSGALLTGNPDDPVLPASYIAPFFTKLPPDERDSVLYYDKGSYFLAQWEKHFDTDDHHMLKFRVKLYPDGTIRFFYRNFVKAATEAVEKTSFPAIIGVQDGFAAEQDKAVHVYVYPGTFFPVEKLEEQPWSMITLLPVPGCLGRPSMAECNKECTPCGTSDCVYTMELNRPDSFCHAAFENCSQVCSLEMNSVCGSDGVTYSNPCLLKNKACHNKEYIVVKHSGNCEGPKPGIDYCKVKCPAVVTPVCGTDQRTYQNKCVLFQENCRNKQNVEVQEQGACGGVSYDDLTEIKDPPPEKDEEYVDESPIDNDNNNNNTNKNNVSQLNSTSTTTSTNNNPDCNATCDANDTKVFCLNGATVFPNLCSLKVATCQKKIKIVSSTEGYCPTNLKTDEDCELNRGCPNENSPVCASNNITYQNECTVRQLNCNGKLKLVIVKKGHCESEPKTDSSNDDNNSGCDGICTKKYMPVCGSNNVTYNNECLLRHDNCLMNENKKTKDMNYIVVQYKQACFNSTLQHILASVLNVPADKIPSEKEQSIEERNLAEGDGEGASKVSSSSTIFGVLGLFIFVAMLGLAVFYQRRSQRLKRIRQMAAMSSISTRSSTDSWLDPDTQEYRDQVRSTTPPDAVIVAESSGQNQTNSSTSWPIGVTRPIKNDKLPLVPNIEEEHRKNPPL